MNRDTFSFCLLVLALAGLSGCSSEPSTNENKKAATAPDKIQGKAQVTEESTASDSAMNAGGPSVYLVDGLHRYRLFFKTATPVVTGKEYAAEGVYAQKAIDEIGDPEHGRNGYPLPASCDRVVKMAWSGMAFDVADGYSSTLRAKVKRFPARAVFLVTRLQPVDSAATKKEGEDKDIKEVPVAADKQRALQIEAPPAQPAPLWEPAGGTVHCKVTINPEGKISELDTGIQLCEAVDWSKFRYQPPVQGGHPVRVKTEVEVKFEARK